MRLPRKAVAKHSAVASNALDLDIMPELEINAVAERRLVRKLDLLIIPIIMLLYLFSFLDRVNIGNARLYGLEDDLSLTGTRYQTAVAVIFATYITTEVPSNLVLKKLRPSRWISFIATSWGIIATLTGLVQSYSGLIIARLFLGAVEGGLYPGLIVYLTLFYEKKELALRTGYLFVSAALAGAFGGLLAYGIGRLDGVAGLRAWRWIFIIEGLPTVVLGIICWFLLADEPSSAWYFNEEERELMRLRRTRQLGHTSSTDTQQKKDVLAAFKDWKIWMFCIGQIGFDTMLYGYSTFLPTIIESLNFENASTATIQLLTVPCYALGAITYLVIAYLSDRQQRRAPFIIGFGVVSIIGYAILLSDATNGIHYFGCFLVAMGLYVSVGLCYPLLASNLPRYGKRTTGIGLQLTIGNAAGIYAPYLYQLSANGIFTTGHAATLALVAMASCIHGILWWYFSRENRARRRGEHDSKYAHMSQGEVDDLGDDSPRFLYTT